MLTEYRPRWGRILRQAGRPLAAFTVFALFVTVTFELGYSFRVFALPDLPISLLGSALGIFLGFRTNSAYSRWWEARILWGGLTNQSRSWAREILSFTDARMERGRENVAAWQTRLIHAQIAFAHALRCHLRGENAMAAAEPFLAPDLAEKVRGHRNIPSAILHHMGVEVARAADAEWFGEMRLLALDSTLTQLTNVQGGCERIRNTPLPRQYDYYPEVFVYGYCFLLPLAVVQELGFVTPFVTFLVGLVLVVLNGIGKNLEDPFHHLTYGTPMTAISRNIEIELRERLGESNLPEPLEPDNGVLI